MTVSHESILGMAALDRLATPPIALGPATEEVALLVPAPPEALPGMHSGHVPAGPDAGPGAGLLQTALWIVVGLAGFAVGVWIGRRVNIG